MGICPDLSTGEKVLYGHIKTMPLCIFIIGLGRAEPCTCGCLIDIQTFGKVDRFQLAASLL